MLLGVLGVCLECAWPGRYVAGAGGVAMWLLGLAALTAFPMEASGVMLVVLAVLSFAVHARRRLLFVPAAGGAMLLALGIHLLISAPRIGLLPALALAIPGSLAVGLLLDIARRSRNAKRQLINTGLDAAQISTHNRETRSELCPRENRSGHDDQDQRR